MRAFQSLDRLAIRLGRLGFTDIYHDRVRTQGVFGQAFILVFGTAGLGNFANGIYLKRLLKNTHFPSILDAGCGDGTFAFYVASRCPDSQVLSVDIGEQGLHGMESTLDICHRIHRELPFPNLRFEQRDLRQLNVCEAFDLVYSFDVLEHIRKNKLVLQNIFRSLRRGGLLLFRIPTRTQKRILNPRFTAEHARWAEVEHVGQHYDMPTLLADLREIGFRIESAEFTVGFWGRLSFELLAALEYYRVPEFVKFGTVPILKALRYIDTCVKVQDGDGLLVLCRRP